MREKPDFPAPLLLSPALADLHAEGLTCHEYSIGPVRTVPSREPPAPRLVLSMLDADWLQKRMKERPRELAHETRDDEPSILLTATTSQLQAFTRRHAKEMFAVDTMDYTRVP